MKVTMDYTISPKLLSNLYKKFLDKPTATLLPINLASATTRPIVKAYL